MSILPQRAAAEPPRRGVEPQHRLGGLAVQGEHRTAGMGPPTDGVRTAGRERLRVRWHQLPRRGRGVRARATAHERPQGRSRWAPSCPPTSRDRPWSSSRRRVHPSGVTGAEGDRRSTGADGDRRSTGAEGAIARGPGARRRRRGHPRDAPAAVHAEAAAGHAPAPRHLARPTCAPASASPSTTTTPPNWPTRPIRPWPRSSNRPAGRPCAAAASSAAAARRPRSRSCTPARARSTPTCWLSSAGTSSRSWPRRSTRPTP